MENSPTPGTSLPSPLSFPELGVLILGIYSAVNAIVLLLLLCHALPDPLSTLFFFALVGPPILALVIFAYWCNKARPGRSGVALVLLWAGVAGLAALNLLFLNSAAASV